MIRQQVFHAGGSCRLVIFFYILLLRCAVPLSALENGAAKVNGIRGATADITAADAASSSEVMIASGEESTSLSFNAENDNIPLASLTVPLHAHSNSFHVYLFVGSPQPQRQTLIFDTGSRYTAFPCVLFCKQCGLHASKKFNGTKSTTLTTNTYPNCIYAKPQKDPNRKDDSCIFHQTYLEGSSWTAKEMEDLIWLATADQEESIEDYMRYSAIPFVFGCQTSVTGPFVHQYADGILGMGRALNENAFLSSMVKFNVIERAAFSTCLTRRGGSLSLGGSGLAARSNHTTPYQDLSQQQYHFEPMRFADLQRQAGKGLYSLQIRKVYVGEICITCGNSGNQKMAETSFRAGRGGLLDTGTTDTFFPKNALPAFQEAWEKITDFAMQERRLYRYDEFLRIPDITMVFTPNASLVIPATSYMENVPFVGPGKTNTTIFVQPDAVQPWTGLRRLIMRIYCEEKAGATLGANSLYHYDVLYDLEANRVGLAKSNCGS